MAKRQTEEQAAQAAAEQAEIDRIEVLEFEADERRKVEAAAAEAERELQRVASHKGKPLKQGAGEQKLFLTYHTDPDRKSKVSIIVREIEGCSHTVRCKCTVWAAVNDEREKKLWEGLKPTRVAIQNDAAKVVGWLEAV
jgi:hypothetical protein